MTQCENRLIRLGDSFVSLSVKSLFPVILFFFFFSLVRLKVPDFVCVINVCVIFFFSNLSLVNASFHTSNVTLQRKKKNCSFYFYSFLKVLLLTNQNASKVQLLTNPKACCCQVIIQNGGLSLFPSTWLNFFLFFLKGKLHRHWQSFGTMVSEKSSFYWVLCENFKMFVYQ